MAGTQASAAHAAVLQERARIARDLHDSVSQTLYAITLTASRALQLLNQAEGEQMQLHKLLGDVAGLADSGQSELRSLMADMRSDPVLSGELAAGLTRLAADVRTRHGLHVQVSVGMSQIWQQRRRKPWC